MVDAAPRSPSARPNLKWLAVVPYLLLLIGAVRTFGHSVDDSYITFRYAANLLHGHGPVFNVGERVEGYSSPLHMLLSAVLLLGSSAVDILFLAKLSSLLFGMLTLWQMSRLARFCGLRGGQILFAQTLVALNINFAIASVNALETSLYAFLLITSVGVFLSEMRRKPTEKRGVASGFWLFVTLLARPDTLLVFLGLLVVRAYHAQKQGQGQAGTLRWAAAFLGPMVLLMACRYAYYGYPLPNTYYAKNVSIGYGIKFGIPYLQYPLVPFDRLNEHVAKLTLVTMIIFWGLALVGVGRACRRGRVAGLVCVAVILAESGFVLRSGGDWMSGWRFMASALPFFAMLQVSGVITLLKALRKPARKAGSASSGSGASYGLVLSAAVLAVWAAAAFLSPHVSWSESGYSTRGVDLMRSDEAQNGAFEVMVGEYVRDHLQTCQSVAYSEMGYASFINQDKKFVDVHGLTETWLAHRSTKYKQRIGFVDRDWQVPGGPLNRYLLKKRPDAIIIVARSNKPAPTEPVLETWKPVTVVGPAPTARRARDGSATVAHVFVEQSRGAPSVIGRSAQRP